MRDGIKELPDQRHEKYVIGRAKGMPGAEAYRAAGYTSNGTGTAQKGHQRLSHRADVRARLAFLTDAPALDKDETLYMLGLMARDPDTAPVQRLSAIRESAAIQGWRLNASRDKVADPHDSDKIDPAELSRRLNAVAMERLAEGEGGGRAKTHRDVPPTHSRGVSDDPSPPTHSQENLGDPGAPSDAAPTGHIPVIDRPGGAAPEKEDRPF